MAKKMNGPTIFILMQVFFVIFGFSLFFGLKEMRDHRRAVAKEREAAIKPAIEIHEAGTEGQSSGEPECTFAEWVGKPVDMKAIQQTGRPARVLPPGSIATMDFNPERINIHTDEDGKVLGVTCG